MASTDINKPVAETKRKIILARTNRMFRVDQEIGNYTDTRDSAKRKKIDVKLEILRPNPQIQLHTISLTQTYS